jgi:PAS domain S-box-containing protein
MPEPTTGTPRRPSPPKPEDNVVRLRPDPDPARREASLCRAILASASDYAIVTTDSNGRVTSWNAGARNLLGWAEAEALGMDGRLLFTPEDRAAGAPEAEMEWARKEGRAEDERWHLRQDGTRFWGSGLMTPLRDSPVPGFLKIMRDRTDKREAEAALAAAHRRASEILESVTDAFYAVDRDWRLTYVNRRAEQLWGRPRDRLLGHRLWEVFPGVADLEATEDYRLHARAARGRAPLQAEFRSAALGSWVSASFYPQADGGGLSVYFRDVGARKEAEERQALLLKELAHRVKNTLALVLSLARQTGARATAVADFLGLFEGRLRALAVVHELLTESGWRSASLVALARLVLAAHAGPGEEGEGRITAAIEDDVPLRPAAAQDLVLVLHELATNAAKHGALSAPGGAVALEGRVEGGELILVWREAGGPPAAPPAARGFGSTLLEQAVAHQQGGRVELDWRPEGLACTLRLPLAAVMDGSARARGGN